MPEDRDTLKALHKRHIRNTEAEQIVTLETASIAFLPSKTTHVTSARVRHVYITTKILKHLYDRKPAQEYDFILENMTQILEYPDRVYKNPPSKKGHFAFVKNIDGSDYLCSLEVLKEVNFAVTCFQLRKPNYLRDYKLLWDWEDDNPPS